MLRYLGKGGCSAMRTKLAYCFSDSDYTVAKKVTLGVNEFLHEHPDVQIYCFHEIGKYGASDAELGQNEIFELAKSKQIEGYVIQSNTTWPRKSRAEFIEHLRKDKPNVPIATIDDRFDDCFFVGTDNYASEYEITSVLLQKIRNDALSGSMPRYGGSPDASSELRALFIGGPDQSAELINRERGFHEACRDNGLRSGNISSIYARKNLQDGYRIGRDLLRQDRPLPNLIVCAYDVVASSLANILIEHGIDVPEDIVICGFDNFDLSRNFKKRLPSIARDDKEVVKCALELVLNSLRALKNPHLDSVQTAGLINRDVYVPYDIQYEEKLFDGTPLSEANADELLKEVIRARRASFNTRFEELNYYQLRDDMSNAMANAKSTGEIMETFEQYAGGFMWGNLYIAISTEYRHGVSDLKSLTHYPDKMALVAIVRDHPELSVPVTRPDPVTHIYSVFDTADLLPDSAGETSRLMNIFALHSGKLCIGYLVAAGDMDLVEYNHIGSFNKMFVNLIEDCRTNAVLQRLNEQMRSLYTHDSLTKLYNRFGLESAGKKFFNTLRHEKPVTFLFVDVDDMKSVNDLFGHRAGDEMLRNCAIILQTISNVYGLFAMRYGGDEFLLFGSADGDTIAAEIRRQTSLVVVHNYLADDTGKCVGQRGVEVSIGKYIFNPDDNMSLEECIISADRRMYKDKRQRKRSRDSVKTGKS
jgi:diguanylate cyclase (GGDEF)-like protein